MAEREVVLSADMPIDVQRAIELLGNQEKIFYQMLGKLEKLSLNPAMIDIAEAINEQDFNKYKTKVHSLKGASGYIGASNLHYSCYHIQEHFYVGNYQEMLELYPLLVESAIEFKIESRNIIQRHKDGHQAVLMPDVFTCPLADGYRIQQHDKKFLCLKNDQSSK